METKRYYGVLAGLGAAALFGLGTPFAKLLLGQTSAWLLAALLYLGAGIGLAAWRVVRGDRMPRMTRADLWWLAAAVIAGGILAPVALMWGLTGMPATQASLLLNAEAVFTALFAWLVFRENFDRRIAAGMVLIVLGAALLTWPSESGFGGAMPALAIVTACVLWAIDNNVTRKVSLADATFIAMIKGLCAGGVNLLIAISSGSTLPTGPVVLAAGALGFVSYGMSLVLFVVALRHLGTARTGAYFSTAPFCGALVAVMLLGEQLRPEVVAAGMLMAAGVWLHLTERHVHEHAHEVIEHEHEHEHDAHHRHSHTAADKAGPDGDVRHSHWHRHEPLTHTHPHYPDAHHRHGH